MESNEDSITLCIFGELDVISVPEIREAIEEIVQAEYNHVIVNLSGLTQIDASGVGVFTSLLKRLRTQDRTLEIRGVNEQPLSIFQVLRLDKILQLK